MGLMRELARTLSGPEAVHIVIPTWLVKYESRPDTKDEEIRKGTLPEYRAHVKMTVAKDIHSRK